jgi:hypothetical protein
VTFSDVEGGFPGTGNINEDPKFISVASDNYRLAGTACIDAGSNAAVPASLTTDLDGFRRIFDGAVDMGAYEFIPPRTVTQWRSVRTHSGSGELAIELDPDAGSACNPWPTVETRDGGIRKIELDFDQPVTLLAAAPWTGGRG